MSVVNSSQKFIARNRAPRVQIEYDVEVYGSEKRVELPFVMGVLADLSGTQAEPLPAVLRRGCNGQRQPVRSPALPLCLFPFRSLPQVHRA